MSDRTAPEGSAATDAPGLAQLEQMAKIAIASAVFFYVVGFIGCSLRMAQWGVYFLDSLNGQYVIAGIWLVLPAFMAYGLFAALSMRKIPTDPRIAVSAVVMLAIVAAGIQLTSKLAHAEEIPLWQQLASFTGAMLVALFMIFSGNWILKQLRDTLAKARGTVPKPVLAVVLLGFGYSYIAYMSWLGYFYLPTGLPGSFPVPIRLLMKADKNSPIVVRDGESACSIQYVLLGESEKEYVLQKVYRGDVFFVRKEAADGIVFVSQQRLPIECMVGKTEPK